MNVSQAQPIPKVTSEDVERIVRRDFSADDYDTVMTILSGYGMEDWHRERIRVQIAALKIADGSVDKLRSCIDCAKSDYRDALAAAEYPAYCKSAWDLPFAERDRIIDADWRQYEDWLKRSVRSDP